MLEIVTAQHDSHVKLIKNNGLRWHITNQQQKGHVNSLTNRSGVGSIPTRPKLLSWTLLHSKQDVGHE